MQGREEDGHGQAVAVISQQELAVRHVNVKMHNFNLWSDPVTKAEEWDCIGLYLKTGAHAYSAFKLKAASVQHHIQINGSHYPLLTYFNGKSRRAPERSKPVRRIAGPGTSSHNRLKQTAPGIQLPLLRA